MAMFTVLPWIILNYMAEFVLKKKKGFESIKTCDNESSNNKIRCVLW